MAHENKNIPAKYKSIVPYYTNKILNSRLMLDDDLEAVLSNFDFKIYDSEHNRWKMDAVFSISSVLTASLAVKFTSKLYILSVPTAVVAICRLRRTYLEYTLKKNIDSLINSFNNLHKLNADILEYLKMREILNLMKSDETQVISTEFENFMRYAFNEIVSCLKIVSNAVITMYRLVNDDIEFPDQWSLNHLNNLCDFNTYEECCENFHILKDACILLISNFLSCLGLSLCPNLCRDSSEPRLDDVFEETVPKVERTFRKLCFNVSKSFNNFRFALNKSQAFRKECKESIKSIHLSRIERPLINFLNQTQIAFELGVHLQNKLNKSGTNLANVSDVVVNLRDQLTMCDNSLDTFCKAYSILIKRAIENKLVRDEAVTVVDEERNLVANTINVRYDDEDLEPAQDEEYDLYIRGSDEEDFPATNISHDDESSAAYLTMMLQELKNKLRERQVLRAKKLGLPLQEFEEPPLSTLKPEETTTVSPLGNQNGRQKDIKQMNEEGFIPPCPSLPNFVHKYDENLTCNLADVIKFTARKRSCEEETFGDSSEEENKSC